MDTSELITRPLLLAHIIGLAAIIGSYILQMPWRRGFDFRPLVIGSVVAVVTGCGLIAVRAAADLDVDRSKMTVKLGVALVVLAVAATGLVRARRLRRANLDDAGLKPLLLSGGIAAMANVAVALLWR